MEKKPVYCECPKKPGGVLEIEGRFGPDMIHVRCGKKIGPSKTIIGYFEAGEDGGRERGQNQNDVR